MSNLYSTSRLLHSTAALTIHFPLVSKYNKMIWKTLSGTHEERTHHHMTHHQPEHQTASLSSLQCPLPHGIFGFPFTKNAAFYCLGSLYWLGSPTNSPTETHPSSFILSLLVSHYHPLHTRSLWPVGRVNGHNYWPRPLHNHIIQKGPPPCWLTSRRTRKEIPFDGTHIRNNLPTHSSLWDCQHHWLGMSLRVIRG